MKTSLLILALLICCSPVSGASSSADGPWWDEGKIRYFWGAWTFWHPLGLPHTCHGSVYTLPDEDVIARVAQAGATVFADRNNWTFEDELPERFVEMARTAWQPEATHRLFRLTLRSANLNRARLARGHGVRYFGQLHTASGPLDDLAEIGARPAVNKKGLTSGDDPRAKGRFVPCPLDEKAVGEWLFRYALDMAETGLVDGVQIDWEHLVSGFYYEVGDDLCYCDDCWGVYAKQAGTDVRIARADRYAWLTKHGRLRGYLTHQQSRVIAIYRRGAARVREVKPDFIFAAYDGFMPGNIEHTWFVEGAARGLNAPDAPFFMIDSSHYYPNHNIPWWNSAYVGLRKLGMKHILGHYISGLMGAPTMDVGAVQQLYDAAINTDGYWVWFERQWGPADDAVFRAADKRVRAVENRVGDVLRDGELDWTFATLVEQSGDPELGRNVLTRGYHLGDRHLVQVNNVNTDHSVSVLVRLPRVEPDGRWVVTDPVSGLFYAHGGEPTWRAQDLRRGVLIVMDKRSDAWLLLTPSDGSARIARTRIVAGDVIMAQPDRPVTGPVPEPGEPAAGDFPLVFTRQGPLGYQRAHQPVLGTSIYMTDAAGGGDSEARLLFAIKGNCRSPRLSPDRTTVVFSSCVNGKGQIHVVNADAEVLTGFPGRELPGKPYWVNTLKVGSRRTGSFAFKSQGVNLSKNDYCDRSPVCSPDGNRIAFVSDRDGDWNIYVMNADGSGQKRLTDSPGIDRSPSWSPDGEQLAFESNRDGDFDIYLIGRDGVGEHLLAGRSGNDLDPVWSPDGTRVAFVGNGRHRCSDIMLVDPRSGAIDYARGLLFAITGWWPYENVHSIRWSPDGRHIAGAYEGQDATGVFVARAGLSRPAADAAEVVIGYQFTYDSTRTADDLVELIDVPPLKTRPGGVVHHRVTGGWYLNGDASNRWLMRTFRDIAWSPDGRTIAFRSDMDPSGYAFFYTVTATGGKAVRIDDTLSPMGEANKPGS